MPILVNAPLGAIFMFGFCPARARALTARWVAPRGARQLETSEDV